MVSRRIDYDTGLYSPGESNENPVAGSRATALTASCPYRPSFVMVIVPEVPLAAPPFTDARLMTAAWRAPSVKATVVTGVMPPAAVHRRALPETVASPGFWMIRTVTCPPKLL